ncbi:MAG: hypothetical protein M1831_002136 [Alyxoria varia]|nr:MAG: hypothetical protein M1831_002136 [Alyxoria varia]
MSPVPSGVEPNARNPQKDVEQAPTSTSQASNGESTPPTSTGPASAMPNTSSNPINTSSTKPSSSLPSQPQPSVNVEPVDSSKEEPTTTTTTTTTTLDASGRPARKRSLLDVSQRSSSGRNRSAASEGKSSGGGGGGPGGSKERRKGGSQRSAASAKRHQKADGDREASQSGANQQQTSQPDSQQGTTTRPEDSVSKPKRGGVSRFLAILNCCKAPEDSKNVDSTTPGARKVPVERVSQSTQNTPPLKSDLPQPEQSSADTKETLGQNSTSDAGHSRGPATDKKEPVVTRSERVSGGDRSNQDIPLTDMPHPPPSSGEKTGLDKPLPASPNSPPGNVDIPQTLVTGANNPSKSDQPRVSLSPPTPIVQEGEELISDRTPEQKQKDEDIEMKDVPPSLPLAGADVPGQGDGSFQAKPLASTGDAKVDLPPPPPPSDRNIALNAPSHELAPTQSSGSSISETPQDDRKFLLPALRPEHKGRKCLVLDLDETLVHSSFKVLHQADFTIPVEIEGQFHNVYVIKRPGVDQFMKRVGELYEVVVFTASVAKYGDPLLDQLDIHRMVHHRLFRESCYNHQGNYVKDLGQVGRDLRDTIIIDNSPTSYIFHPQHAVPISSWFSDAHDNELLDLIPVLEDLAGDGVEDVSLVLDVGL